MRRRKEVFSSLNIVPYLDVMLVLLVIFMATTPIVQTGINVNLPVGKAGVLHAQKPVILTIDHNGKRSLQIEGEAPVAVNSSQAMQQWFLSKQINKERAIHLQADRSLSWQRVLSVLVQVNQMGWSKIALSTQAEAGDSGDAG